MDTDTKFTLSLALIILAMGGIYLLMNDKAREDFYKKLGELNAKEDYNY